MANVTSGAFSDRDSSMEGSLITETILERKEGG